MVVAAAVAVAAAGFVVVVGFVAVVVAVVVVVVVGGVVASEGGCGVAGRCEADMHGVVGGREVVVRDEQIAALLNLFGAKSFFGM